jgi:hypothetical protein
MVWGVRPRIGTGLCSSVFMIVRNCSLILGNYMRCRFRKIISNRIGLTCGVLPREQFVSLGSPGDHEQSGAAVVVPDCIPRLELRPLNR